MTKSGQFFIACICGGGIASQLDEVWAGQAQKYSFSVMVCTGVVLGCSDVGFGGFGGFG
jgi:hypothetical protein